MSNILENYNELVTKVAARQKSKKTLRKKNQVAKSLNKATVKYHNLRKNVLNLESQKAKLEEKLESTTKEFEKTREEMLKLKEVLGNLDLTDSNKAVFYDCGDVSYVIDDQEAYVDVNNCGEYTTKPYSDYKKEQKNNSKDCADCDNMSADDLKVTELEDIIKRYSLEEEENPEDDLQNDDLPPFPPYRFQM